MDKQYLRQLGLYISVKGYFQGLIVDLKGQDFSIVPNSLIDFIEESKSMTINNIREKYADDQEIINEYAEFLLSKKYAILSGQTENYFPLINLKWSIPTHISNAILELNSWNAIQIINELSNLKCYYIEIRILASTVIERDQFYHILNTIESSKIINCVLMLDFSNFHQEIENISNFNKVNSVCLFNAMEKDNEFVQIKKLNVYYTAQNLINNSECGKINKGYFSINKSLFTESQHFNTCLNKKISIDAEGEIKNCPSMTKSFGNIKDTTLKEALEKQGFKDYWGIRKDDIDVCKDCEFRYMCTDCRAYIKDENNIYSQPAKCNYNPYIAKWKGEADYITVEAWRQQNPDWEKEIEREPLVKMPQEVE